MPIAAWRAACIQMQSRLATRGETPTEAWTIIDANVARAVALIDAACASEAAPKLVVLPEFAFQGPPHGEDVEHWIAKACDTIPGRATAPLQAAARRHGIFVAGNMFEVDPIWPGRFFNSCFLIDPSGAVILRFRRINTALWPSPHDFMDEYFGTLGPDGTFPVVDTELGRLGMIACGEIAVPEVARMLMMRGAEVILHPTNEEFSPGQEAAKVARAAENMVYIVSANVAGGIGFSADGSVLGGRSHIIDFRGRTLAFEPGSAETTSCAAMIDIDALRAGRNDTGMGNALLRGRWDMYRSQLGTVSIYPPNQFLREPMTHSGQTGPLAATALANLHRAGIVVPHDR